MVKTRKGFTLVELIVVISILGVLCALMIPVFNSMVEKSRETVCKANCRQMTQIYNAYLITEKIDHSNLVFSAYRDKNELNICPSDGEIGYEQNSIVCNLHNHELDHQDDSEDESETVPFIKAIIVEVM